MLRRYLICVSTVLALLSGCLAHKYQVQGVEVAEQPTYDEWHHHVVGGLIDLADPVDIQRACPAGVARIEDRVAPVQALISIVTLFIYTPTRVRVWCAAS